MAKKQNLQNTSSIETNTFGKGMNKDLNASLEPKQNWSHARNAYNNSVDGDVGVIGNEPANLQCSTIPYTVIGAIHKIGDKWIIYSTDDINSEIGLFDDSKCEYTTLVNSKCLGFNRKYLITGASKENYDCTWQVYWDDNLNPSRTLNLDDIPYIQVVTSPPGADCIIYEDTPNLDCEKLRLAPLMSVPCVRVERDQNGGQLRNGSYQIYIAYVVNEQRVTDYISVSNIQSLFDHSINTGSLRIFVENLDKGFEYYQAVVLSDNQGAKVAKVLGIYSTEQSIISVDFIDPSLEPVGLDILFLRASAYEKSESMYVVSDYLIRQGPTKQFDFNYQPLANNIKANWVVAEYPSDYYFNGGNKAQFLRDEQYSFFIRWVYTTGEKSASYHIPGRAPKFNGYNQFGTLVDETGVVVGGPNTINGPNYNFQIFNTATVDSVGLSEPTEDGGTIISRGQMAYWQSTEKYPATRPDIWADLCGKEIRHHKFPTEETHESLQLSSQDGVVIRILGVEFNNIEIPKFNDGTIIPNIAGYEILRGSREGNKSIIGKGVIRNMRKFTIPDNQGNLGPKQGFYPNFPYNDLRADVYHHDGTGDVSGAPGWSPLVVDIEPRTDGCEQSFTDSKINFPPLTGYSRRLFTFHSPDLMFRRPFLNTTELRVYGALSGRSLGQFIKSEKHPQNVLLRNSATIIGIIVGLGYAIQAAIGVRKRSSGSNDVGVTQNQVLPNPIDTLGSVGSSAAQLIAQLALPVATGAGMIPLALTGSPAIVNLAYTALSSFESLGGLFPGGKGTRAGESREKVDPSSEVPGVLGLFLGTALFKSNIVFGAQKILDIIYKLTSPEDFAFKFNSQCLMLSYFKIAEGDIFRTKIERLAYLNNVNVAYTEDVQINNINRPDTVAVLSKDAIQDPDVYSGVIDNSRYTIGGDATSDYGDTYLANPEVVQKKNVTMHYAASKFNFENQYGQIDGIKQTVMQNCLFEVDTSLPDSYKYETTPIFSGDTYVNRYTEKVIMPIYSDFLLGQPDQYPYNYLQRQNIPYPRFWMNTRKYDVSDFVDKLYTLGLEDAGSTMPNDLFYLDRGLSSCGFSILDLFAGRKGNSIFAMRYGYMYTHVNGILDFFTESEINLANRDWEDRPDKRYYDPFRYSGTDITSEIFHSEIIKSDNFYKYDYSLSSSRFITNLTSAGNIQARDYDPLVAETCFVNYPKRLIYSLQAQKEGKKDFWRVFVENNYKDFKNRVNVIKPINKSGAIIFFPYQSPQMFQGLDQLETDLGTKLTLGDGGLFTQAMQSLVNSDLSNEYGSCESQRGVINTPYGFFFISQAQGKIFQQSGQGLNPISNLGLKWWFNKYLPSILIEQFPEMEESELGDNPVVGVGCQIIYDITDDIVYICKKDFKLKDKYKGIITFLPEEEEFQTVEGAPPPEGGLVSLVGRTKIDVGDPEYFDNCSWTVSYDPKSKAWISFHDWHPDLCLPSVEHFLTTKTLETKEPQCPPGYILNPITGNCELLIDETAPAVVTVLETAATINGCPPGFTYNESSETCERITTAPIICGIIYNVIQAPPNAAYGKWGAIFYETTRFRSIPALPTDPVIEAVAISGPPIPNQTMMLQDSTGVELGKDLILNLVPPPPTGVPANYLMWSERLNDIGVWTGLVDGSGNHIPVQEWIGFTECVEVPESKEYCVGLAADNRMRFKVNGQLFVEFNYPTGGTADDDNFAWFHIIPIYLEAGTNIIEVQGYNDGSFASFGAEIYDATSAELQNPSVVSTVGDLADITIFSTQEIALNGGTFQSGDPSGCQCPDGFSLSFCEGELQCVQIETAPAGSCECPEGYSLVYPDSNNGYTIPPNAHSLCDPDNPPICRLVDCNCPEPPVLNATTTTTGRCDDLYQTGPNGNLDYVNLDPLICNYFKLVSELPNYKVGSIWKHNYRCDLYANYYGVDYPWEIELIETTGQMVNTVRSLEYQLEAFVYKGDLHDTCGDDRWHDLDFNFDESVIYNSEQISGLLKLELHPKEDPLNMITYPIIGPNDIKILYSKEEQKYRFNQFWDITNDRGEFSNSEEQAFITQLNGYIRDLNALNLNYDKPEEQRKKFRHYYNKVILRRVVSGDRKMLLKLNNTKLNMSYR
jgi:hypothetical protein